MASGEGNLSKINSQYLPTVVHIGPHQHLGRLFLKHTGVCEANFLHVDRKSKLLEELTNDPRAVVIWECQQLTQKHKAITKDFPEATVVCLARHRNICDRLDKTGVFDIVAGEDPAWRFFTALRNAIERAALMEFLSEAVSS